MRGNIFTVPPGQPFLAAVARAILDGHLPREGSPAPDQLALTDYTILLPTRRAARAMQDAFLDAAGGRAMLLPSIRPISEGDEERSLIEGPVGGSSPALADGAAAIQPLDRQLTLARLVLAWSERMRGPQATEAQSLATVVQAGASTPAQAAALARELSTLMDAVETERVDLAGLAGLVPDDYAEHWQKTLEFLKIVTEHWPAHLAERQLVSPAASRNALILAEAARISVRALSAPVIVAGVTGSVPATSELMRALLQDPNGAVVLPGLDQRLDDESWDKLKERHEHPQFGLAKLIRNLGVARGDVKALPGTTLAPSMKARLDLVSEALRPSGSMHLWRGWTATVDRAALAEGVRGVSLISARSTEEEAETVALIMRKVADDPARTAALVTPDRLLARRVAIRLTSWGIRVDDSAGRPFRKTMPGAFLDLVAEAFSTELAPAPLMSLLKHPLTRLGLEAGAVRRAARHLELAAFRRPYLGEGLAGIERAVEASARDASAAGRGRTPAAILSDKDWAGVRDLVVRIGDAFAPLSGLAAGGERLSLAQLVRAHMDAAEALAKPPTPPDRDAGALPLPSPLWQEEAGEAASLLFEKLLDPSLSAPPVKAADYPDLYRTLVASETVRSRIPVHPRLSIWGPYEARLLQPDVVILGSLNEGTWPGVTDPGPWLNRVMRGQLGMPLPEEEIGRAAHDFASLLGGAEVYLTRAGKVGGVPAVPSRWLQRLTALLDAMQLGEAIRPSEPWLDWARARDSHGKTGKPKPPRPRPPFALRPRQASVSTVESWIRNPYEIYARHVLRLNPLPALGAEPGASERGQIIHEALSIFTRRHPRELPRDIAFELMSIADEVVSEMTGVPKVAAFWLPRLERFARWFAETEPARRANAAGIEAEVPGKLVIECPAAPFTLTARADRIDVTGGAAVITDYKSGAPPGDQKVLAQQAPQLPLEAAMLLGGAFTGLGRLTVSGLRYIRASGGEPPGEERIVALDAAGIERLAQDTLDGVRSLVAHYDDPATAYTAVRRPGFDYRYDDYAHLARVLEWAGSDDEEDGNG